MIVIVHIYNLKQKCKTKFELFLTERIKSKAAIFFSHVKYAMRHTRNVWNIKHFAKKLFLLTCEVHYTGKITNGNLEARSAGKYMSKVNKA